MTVEENLERAPNGEAWTCIHPRAWSHVGAVVDLGCASWNWSQRFFGKKTVLGVDPFENQPAAANVSLWNGVVTAISGSARITRNGHGSSTRTGGAAAVDVEALPLAELLVRYGIADVSILKLNVEGAEIEILMTLPERLFPRIDQIAVSFHDFLYGDHRRTEAVLGYLRNWYDVTAIDPRYSWYLAVKR